MNFLNTPALAILFFISPVSASFLGDALSYSELQYEVGDEKIWKVTSSNTLHDDPQSHYYYRYSDYQVFDVERSGKDKVRSELRQFPEWSVSGWRQMQAQVRLLETDLDEVTWMQLHRKSSSSVTPPLRLTLERRREHKGGVYKDYLFAVIHHKSSGYKRVPLGPRPDEDFQATIRVNNYQVQIGIDGTLVHVENVADWADYHCYFKVGLYASGGDADYGEAKMGVRELTFESK
ncbi:polysaccharide lyase family 7 protein [Alcanivorax sp. S6407]|uniref:polysaccharide lyase family 7 protein n=1 Tax=Alcanivorax sp. S6407 TaxID=2926424 RepID=UPI001FF669BF|nr:polysaccharide lyase family 7 protein [Alcanivorax sp. S6407]MCK0152141.1 polysaccharide lyase family 7 protein [Alcanivorax sp. S6407]